MSSIQKDDRNNHLRQPKSAGKSFNKLQQYKTLYTTMKRVEESQQAQEKNGQLLFIDNHNVKKVTKNQKKNEKYGKIEESVANDMNKLENQLNGLKTQPSSEN